MNEIVFEDENETGTLRYRVVVRNEYDRSEHLILYSGGNRKAALRALSVAKRLVKQLSDEYRIIKKKRSTEVLEFPNE